MNKKLNLKLPFNSSIINKLKLIAKAQPMNIMITIGLSKIPDKNLAGIWVVQRKGCLQSRQPFF